MMSSCIKCKNKRDSLFTLGGVEGGGVEGVIRGMELESERNLVKA